MPHVIIKKLEVPREAAGLVGRTLLQHPFDNKEAGNLDLDQYLAVDLSERAHSPETEVPGLSRVQQSQIRLPLEISA